MNDSRFDGKVNTTFLSTGTGPDEVFIGVTEGGYALSIWDVVQVLWRRIWVIVLVAIMLMGLVVGFDLQRTPIYAASSKILIRQQENSNSTVVNDVADLQELTLTMAAAVDSRPVAQATIERLDMPMTPDVLLRNLSAEAVPDTQFIEVTYTDTSKARAQQVVNAVGATFSDRATEISPSANGVTATVWEKAAIPDNDVSPSIERDAVLALVLGVMLGIVLAFLLEHLDDRWRSSEEAEQISGVPTFGVIPEFEISKADERGGED